MIDIHSHIIPCIDDGCENINESLDMIKKAKDCGITKIFATPHFIEDIYENYKEDVLVKVDSLNNLLKISGIDVEVLCGTEIMVCPDIVSLLESGRLCSLNNSRYILIEFPVDIRVPNVIKIIEDILAIGFVPIIAHPERYTYIQKNIKEAIKYVEAGALLQLNVNSLVVDYVDNIRATAANLLKHNLIHFCASDTHIFRDVYGDNLEKSLDELKKIVGDEKFRQIIEINPECVYNNTDIEIFDIKYKFGIFS